MSWLQGRGDGCGEGYGRGFGEGHQQTMVLSTPPPPTPPHPRHLEWMRGHQWLMVGDGWACWRMGGTYVAGCRLFRRADTLAHRRRVM